MNRTLEVGAAAWDEMLRHAREAAPDECCGLLVGREGVVREAIRAPNIASDPVRRFEVDPEAHFRAIRRARQAGLSIVGAYHSHPRGTPVPSETDLEQAFEDEQFLHAIVDPKDGRILAYRLMAGNFVAVPLVRVS